MWQENGDRISKLYAGTDSNISGVIENGKQGFMGKLSQMMTGVERYVVSNFTDSDKQEAIEQLLGHS